MPRYFYIDLRDGHISDMTVYDDSCGTYAFFSPSTFRDIAAWNSLRDWSRDNNYLQLTYSTYPRRSDMGVPNPILANQPVDWHTLPWVGRYAPAVRIRHGDSQYRDYALTLDRTQYTPCGHCALLKAQEMLATPEYVQIVADAVRDGTWAKPIFLYVGEDANPDGLPGPELVGGTCSLMAQTVKCDFEANACGQCGLPGHNRASCTHTKIWDRVGIEVEGRWVDLNAAMNTAHRFSMGECGDGSLRPRSGYSTHEFQTHADNPTMALRQLVAVYPDHTGPDCGMHVHVSFADRTMPTMLMGQGFYDYFKARWEAWGARESLHPESEFFRRLRGMNDFCNPNFEVDDPFSDDRYRQVNFLAWNEHRTVEFRLLPMFHHAHLGISAVLELLSILEDWITGACGELFAPESAIISPEDAAEMRAVAHEGSDIEFGTGLELVAEAGLELISELPPVPHGHVRRVVTEQQLLVLQEMGLIGPDQLTLIAA